MNPGIFKEYNTWWLCEIYPENASLVQNLKINQYASPYQQTYTEDYRIISTDEDITFDKFDMNSLQKREKLSKLEMHWYFLSLIKFCISAKPIANPMAKSERMTRPGCFFFLLFIITLEVLASMRRKEKETEGIHIGKKFLYYLRSKSWKILKNVIRSKVGMV